MFLGFFFRLRRSASKLYTLPVKSQPQKILFLFLKVLFLMKQVNHRNGFIYLKIQIFLSHIKHKKKAFDSLK